VGCFRHAANLRNAILGNVQPAPSLPRLSQRDERFENLGDAVPARANKLGGDLLSLGGDSLCGQGSADGLELLRQLLWPGLTLHVRGGRDDQFALYRRRGDAGLEPRAQPADLAAPFLFGALSIERDQANEEIVFAEIRGCKRRSTPMRPRS
jgi:hypothetical protein